MAIIFHRRLSAFYLPICALVIACGGGGADSGINNTIIPTPTNTSTSTSTNTTTAARPVQQSDIQIAQALYSDTQRTPIGFYSETVPVGLVVATSHVKSADVGSAATPLYELCSDDWTQAYNWSEQAAQASSQYGPMQVSETTDRFFEFTRLRNSQPAGIWRERIFRCNYLDRGSVDLRTAYTHAGQLNRRPLTADSLRELTEYLWLFTNYNNYGNAVLQSASSATSSELKHTLYVASLASNAGANGCDRVDVSAWAYSADTQSGELTLTNTALWRFDTKKLGGLAELCTQ